MQSPDAENIIRSARSAPSDFGPFFVFELSPQASEFRTLPEAEFEVECAATDLCVAASSVFAQLHGWFVPPLGTEIRGLRAVSEHRVFVARRKKMRPEVLAEHPGRLEALFSGFAIKLRLRPGWNRMELQFKDSDKRWHGFAHCAVFLSPTWWLRLLWRPRHLSIVPESHQNWTRRHGDPSPAEFEAMSEFLESFPRRPLISVLMPTYDTDEHWLNRAIESVRAQLYPDWELCIADDASKRPEVRAVIEDWARRDTRIKVRYLESNGHICRASNAALELCSGEFVALLDHDDELPPHALYHAAWEIVSHPLTDVVYSDEDKIGEDGVRSGPYFKPDWNYELLLGQNCVSHLGVYRTSLVREIGGFRPGFEGSQDWDLMLRASIRCAPGAIRHVPRILYHWRTLPQSAASGPTAKPYTVAAGRLAVESHLHAIDSGAALCTSRGDRWQVLWPLPDPAPLVSLVFSEAGPPKAFFHTLKAMRSRTRYGPQFEVVAVGSEQELEKLKRIDDGGQSVRYVPCARDAGLAARCNRGAEAARGEVLVFLDGSLEPSGEDWLRELASQALRADVGAVGACLLLKDGTIQHAGFVLHMAGLIGHLFRFSPSEAYSSGGPPNMAREVTAVSHSAMAIQRDVFREVGGFDEITNPRVYYDVDLCLRLRKRGLRNVFTPFARLTCVDAGRQARNIKPLEWDDVRAETERLVSRWPEEFTRDAFFNPNLSLNSEIPVPTALRVIWPWQKLQRIAEPADRTCDVEK